MVSGQYDKRQSILSLTEPYPMIGCSNDLLRKKITPGRMRNCIAFCFVADGEEGLRRCACKLLNHGDTEGTEMDSLRSS